MTDSLPPYYFRIRENGAAVFRIDLQNRHLRLDMDQIATVNTRNGEIRAQGDRALSEADRTAIADWMDQRRRLLAEREIDDIRRAIDHMNLTAQWAQARASDAQLEAITEDLLLAMHDLRSVLVRKKAERLDDADKNA